MLRGRCAEQATIGRLLADARNGVSGALILRGEPGIGKTALFDHAAERAEGIRVLRGAGVESEAELPFAGLHLLLRPALDRLDALPGPQRQALAGAFGLGAAGSDRFMIGAGVLSLLAEVAERAPLLCLVDDAQWLDRASAEALLFAARRLDREGVVILFAVRDYAGALASAGIPELPLTGLDAASAAALLDDHDTTLPAARRERFVAETRGNPLALLELPALVPAHESRLEPLPLTSRVLDAFHHQVRALPTAARTLLLVAAADDTGELTMLVRAATALGAGLADLAPAETAGLVSLATGTLEFRHPLIRAAVYHGAPLGRRIAVHDALAAAYDGHRDVDRRAWHRAAAATGPDERVADDLERTADRAVARSGHAAAAAAYDRAARLSEDRVAAARRLTLACEAAVQSGQLAWARARAERALREATEPTIEARLAEVRAGADFAQGALRQAHDLLTTGASVIAAEDPVRAFWMVMRALHAAWAAPTTEQLITETVDRFDAVGLAPDAPLMSVAWLARWGTAVALGRDTGTFPPLARTLDRARAAASAAGPQALVEVASRAFLVGHDAECADIGTALVAEARGSGTLVALPAGLALSALAQTLLGRHREATVNGAEGLRIAGDTDQPLWASYASGALAYLAAIEGDEQRCRQHADDAVSGHGAPAGSTWAQAALALLDLGHGRVQDAFDRLRTVPLCPTRHQVAVVRCVPDLVEAAVRLGRPEDAAAPLTRYATWAGALQRPWIDALLARCRALTAPDGEAEQHYRQALDHHGTESRPFERARTELLHGEWLRRSRRKSEARARLGSALQTFEELGAQPWAARARAELGASGAAVPQAATADVFAGLTPQELQITRLAAQGMSNRDIAAQLFLSPRTVAYHLYKAYPKLGITSRGELAALTS